MSIPPYSFGAWGDEPLLFAPHEAWLFCLTKGWRNKWIRINSRTAALNVSPLCELDFKRKFRSLPPLPFGAFRGTDVERKRSDPYDPEEVENRTILEMLSCRVLARKGVGAYRDRDDPEVVYVYACAHSAGGKFSAFRVKGRWKRPSGPVTFGDLADDYLPITDVREVEALLAEARTALSA
jgi:hypothetical protein